jgi:hypothetical protein
MRVVRPSLLVLACLSVACAETSTSPDNPADLSTNDDAGAAGQDSGAPPPLPDGGVFEIPDGMLVVQDPQTCAEAAANRSYIGCDYWPTVVANPVWSIFDFAVVVSNPGTNAATVTVTGPNSTNQTVTVAPGALQKIYLPWVSSLKGGDGDKCGYSFPLAATLSQTAGAYHLVSSVPVLVYQFDALEYKPAGGPAGKDWSTCPGTVVTCPMLKMPIGCYSYSNDASLLLPSTALTGNYRVLSDYYGGYVAITATQNATTVSLKVSSTGRVLSGTGVTAMMAGDTASFAMNAGDVLELVAKDSNTIDLSGSQVQADQPVQVIGGVPCFSNPATSTCDHIEESVLPAETLGQHYVVTMPTGPLGNVPGATVRMVGNVDGTGLTYQPAIPFAPPTLNAGQVVEFDAKTDFVVSGNHEFIVATVMKSGDVVDPTATKSMQEGDPSLSAAIAVEQYRLEYVFLAPDDYDINYADVTAPLTATLMLDGAPVTAAPTRVGGTGYGVFRIHLTSGNSGAHTLTSDQPVGLQVLGYGLYTSYQYPGGLDLLTIAPPPPPIM